MAPQPTTLPPFITHLTDNYYTYIHPLLPAPVQSIISTTTPVVTSLATSTLNGDITSLIMTLAVVYLTLRVADWFRRSVMAWVAFLVKLVIVLLAINAVLYVNKVGVDKAWKDALWAADLVWGLIEGRMHEVANSRSRESVRDRFGGYANARQQVPLNTGGRRRRAGGWS